MENLAICGQAILKIGFIIPLILLLVGWAVVEAVDNKWERRFNK